MSQTEALLRSHMEAAPRELNLLITPVYSSFIFLKISRTISMLLSPNWLVSLSKCSGNCHICHTHSSIESENLSYFSCYHKSTPYVLITIVTTIIIET